MTFDPGLAQCIQELLVSTWFIHGRSVRITHPRAFVLQGIRVTSASGAGSAAVPGGVTWVRGPGPYAGQLMTIIRASTIKALKGERERLAGYLGPAWQVAPLEAQTPAIFAVMRGDLDEPRPDVASARVAV